MLQRSERHLGGAERADHHRRVDVTHMRDAERLAGQAADADTQHDAAFLARVVANGFRVAVLHENVGHRVRALGGIDDVEGENLTLGPAADRAPHGLCQQSVTLECVLQAFREQDVERLAHAEQQVLRRRAAVFHVVLFALPEGPVPIHGPQTSDLVGGVRALAGGDEGKTGRRHHALLRAAHGDVDTPGIHLEGHGAERGDGIDHEQSGMLGRIHGFAYSRNVIDDAGGGVDLHDHHSLDGVTLVGAQALLYGGRVDRLALVLGQHLDLNAHHGGHLAPADGEAAAFEHQDLVTLREHVGERGFPAAVPVGGVDIGAAARGEHFAQVREQRVCESNHAARIDIDGGPLHGLQHLVGHGGRTRDR